MNLGMKLHLTLAFAGLGAFLLVVPAHAQQETNPDHFNENSMEAFQESTKAIPAHRAKAMRARVSPRSVKGTMIALSGAGAKPSLSGTGGAAKKSVRKPSQPQPQPHRGT